MTKSITLKNIKFNLTIEKVADKIEDIQRELLHKRLQEERENLITKILW